MSPEELYVMHGQSGIPKQWEDPIVLVRKCATNPNRPRLIQLCGTEDFLYEDNQRFKQIAEEAGYGHTYMEGPGEHEWPFWDKAIQRVFQFFLEMDWEKSQLY